MKKLLAWMLCWPLVAAAQVGNYPPLIGQTGTSNPANCTVGRLLFRTDVSAGSNLYGCTSANTWTALGATTPAFPVTVTGGVSGGIPYFSSTTVESASALLAQYGIVVGGGAGNPLATSANLTFGDAAAGTGLAIAAGTATTNVAALSVTRTNNNAAVATGVSFSFTDTSSAAGFLPLSITGSSTGTANLLKLDKVGVLTIGTGATTSVGFQLGFASAVGSGFSAIYTTRVTPNGSNYTVMTDGSIGYLNGTSGSQLNVNNTGKWVASSTGVMLGNGGLIFGTTAPVIASGFGTLPTIPASNGTAAFTVNVGTGGTASSGVITMPTATTGWACTANPSGAPQAGAITDTAPTSTTSITLTNYTVATGVALAWPASTVIELICVGY